MKTHFLKLFCSGYCRTICKIIFKSSGSLLPGNNVMCYKREVATNNVSDKHVHSCTCADPLAVGRFNSHAFPWRCISYRSRFQ